MALRVFSGTLFSKGQRGLHDQRYHSELYFTMCMINAGITNGSGRPRGACSSADGAGILAARPQLALQQQGDHGLAQVAARSLPPERGGVVERGHVSLAQGRGCSARVGESSKWGHHKYVRNAKMVCRL